MNIAGIKNFDIENGEKTGISVFVSGCTHNCEGCFNKEAQDFKYGRKFDEVKDIEKIINMLDSKYIYRLTILGGEPMELQNQEGVLYIIKEVRKKLPDKKIWIYSGYTLEELQSRENKTTEEILNTIDVLVDGEFILEKKNLMLKFRGSSNQRILDMKETMKKKQPVLLDLN